MEARSDSLQAILLAWLVLLLGCNRIEVGPEAAPRADRPDFLLVTIDTLRADRVGAYGDPAAATPVIDGLAASGTRFAQAIATAPITLPSHASILTGAYPPSHGVRHNGSFRLDAAAVTLAEQLREAGYATGAVVGAYVLDRRFGLDQGFALYDDEISSDRASSAGYLERRAEDVTARAIEWLARTDSPFFLWVHYYDPHFDHRPPAAYAERFPDDPYAGEIAYVDASLGRLLDALRSSGRFENTVVALTSDHGESLGEHGEDTHAITLYDAALAVPLVFAGPSVPVGRTVEGVVRGVDIAPTLLPLAGLEPADTIDGRDLAPLWNAPPYTSERLAYAETLATQLDFGWSPLFAVRSRDHLYVRAPRAELYDRGTDPDELTNLLESPSPAARSAATLLDREIARVLRSGGAPEPLPVDPEVRERLRALGYVLSDGPVTETGLDPKDGIAAANRLYRGLVAYDSGQYPSAEALLSASVAELPRSSRAHATLAMALMARGELDGAARHLEVAVQLAPESAEYRAVHGDVERLRGRAEEAATAYREAVRIDPDEPTAAIGLMWLHLREGDLEAAARQAERAADADPRSGRTQLRIGRTWEEHRQAQPALAAYARATELEPGLAQAHLASAMLLAHLGRRAEADAQLARTGPLAQDPRTLNDLGIAFAQGRDFERAEALFRRLLADDPGYTRARSNYAFLLRQTGRADEAAKLESRTPQP
jgi:choline-sulfatase